MGQNIPELIQQITGTPIQIPWVLNIDTSQYKPTSQYNTVIIRGIDVKFQDEFNDVVQTNINKLKTTEDCEDVDNKIRSVMAAYSVSLINMESEGDNENIDTVKSCIEQLRKLQDTVNNKKSKIIADNNKTDEEKKEERAEKRKENAKKFFEVDQFSWQDKKNKKYVDICRGAKLIPGTRYSRNFVDWLVENHDESDYLDISDNGEYEVDEVSLKSFKDDWKAERAEKKKKNEDIGGDIDGAYKKKTRKEKRAEKKAAKEAKVLYESYHTEEELKEIREIEKAAEKAAKKAEKEAKKAEDILIKQAEKEAKENKKFLEQEAKAAAKKEKDISKAKEGAITCYYNVIKNYLKKHDKQRYRSYTHEMLINMSVYVYLNYKFDGVVTTSEDGSSPPKQIHFDAHVDEEIFGNYGEFEKDKFIDEVEKQLKYKELKNDLAQYALTNIAKAHTVMDELSDTNAELADKLKPDTTSAYLSGAVSNTFEAALAVTNLIMDPVFAQQQAELLMDATTATLAKFIKSTNNALEESLKQITDISMFTSIPQIALLDMSKGLMTAEDAIAALKDAVNVDVKARLEEGIGEQIANAQNMISRKIGQINQKYGKQLQKFNSIVSKIVNTANQSGSWYIENLSLAEVKAETVVLSYLKDITIDIQDKKQQFADAAVDMLSYNLVQPINSLLLQTQKLIIDKVAQAASWAIAYAKSLAAKAIMKIMGLLGA